MSERTIQNVLLAVWSIALFAGCFAVHTRHQDFPYYYHPDEPGKVEQVQSGKWNFNHPMLLLSATKLRLNFSSRGEPTAQQIVETGRAVSAGFSAMAVVALSLLAFVWRGWAEAIIAGLALTLHHQLYELAHYMKEDSALLMGLALTFLAAAVYARRPSQGRAAFLGVACALAISGKYLGVLSLAIAGPLLWRQKRIGLGCFFGALLAALAIVNLPLLSNLDTFQQSFGREMDFVVHGQRGMTRSVPHSQYWNIFVDNSSPVIWLLLLVFLIARWRERHALTLAEWMIIAFPFAYAVALSFSPKSNDRYFLPATAVFTLLAVLGINDAARMLAGRVQRRVVIGVAALLLIVTQFVGWAPGKGGSLRYERAFQRDDTAELIAWLKTEVPPTAVIAKDNRVGLPDPKRKKHAARLGVIPQKIVAERYAADIGTLEEMRAKGITHVIVSESDYGKFFLQTLRPQKDEAEDFARRRAFYESLFRDHEPVWERRRGTVIYLHPGIRVYEIPPAPAASTDIAARPAETCLTVAPPI